MAHASLLLLRRLLVHFFVVVVVVDQTKEKPDRKAHISLIHTHIVSNICIRTTSRCVCITFYDIDIWMHMRICFVKKFNSKKKKKLNEITLKRKSIGLDVNFVYPFDFWLDLNKYIRTMISIWFFFGA